MSMPDANHVVLTRDGDVATLSFNRPAALNALDVPTAAAFLAACRTLARDPQPRAVVIRGEGRAFGVGGDLAALRQGTGETVLALIEYMHEGIKILAALDAPVIASVHGAVAGGSLSLSLACDLAIAAEGTRFNLAYTSVAASCDVSGSWSLPRMVGLRHALRIALLSPTVDAAEALQLGLVCRVVPAWQLEQETRELAQRLAAGPTLAYGRMKRLMRQSFEHDFASQLDAEREAFKASSETADFSEAIAAFFDKRPAVFKGG
ncbi:enoyl-CoA hydratase/isomerase family protein [Rugamonas apoptosis]|uniref:Enoyl-CoA hydratase/isomerase family protein n=1 Tax=Rugamonas apoptosis TaxID=2758570 RepID=A0A7W2F7Q0_9BURK|nr:enoyl-CoA hydratase-related protein [Rugamonas apoptosis]MBA5686662.1 enoyl-CoA hydratase/isomerase family protein [Rugamonas apoptosis]